MKKNNIFAVTEDNLLLAESVVGPIPRLPNGNVMLNGRECEVVPASTMPPEEERIVVGVPHKLADTPYEQLRFTCMKCAGDVWVSPMAPPAPQYVCTLCYERYYAE